MRLVGVIGAMGALARAFVRPNFPPGRSGSSEVSASETVRAGKS